MQAQKTIQMRRVRDLALVRAFNAILNRSLQRRSLEGKCALNPCGHAPQTLIQQVQIRNNQNLEGNKTKLARKATTHSQNGEYIVIAQEEGATDYRSRQTEFLNMVASMILQAHDDGHR
jgi:acetylglutamate synthase